MGELAIETATVWHADGSVWAVPWRQNVGGVTVSALPLPPAKVLMRTAFDPIMPLGAWFMANGRFMPSVVRHVKGGG